MSDLPKQDFTAKDADQLISDYGKPLDPVKKNALMSKLKAQQKEFEKGKKNGRSTDRADDGQSR